MRLTSPNPSLHTRQKFENLELLKLSDKAMVFLKRKIMAVKFNIPENISDETGKFIKDVLKELNKKKAIQNIDLGALNMLTVSYEMYLKASTMLLKDGPITQNKYGDKIPHPAQTIATKNYGQVMKIMTEYGLTIKSRTSIKSATPDEGTESPLDKFFNAKR